MSRQPKGFSETQQAGYGAAAVAAPLVDTPAAVALTDVVPVAGQSGNLKLKVGPGGRVVIPAEVRRAMGVIEGDALLGHFDGETLSLTGVDAAVRRVQEAFRDLAPHDVSLVDELIADRRREAGEHDAGHHDLGRAGE